MERAANKTSSGPVFGNVPRAGGSVSAVTVRELEPDGAVIDTVHGSGASDFIALDAQESGVVRGDLLPPPQSATVVAVKVVKSEKTTTSCSAATRTLVIGNDSISNVSSGASVLRTTLTPA